MSGIDDAVERADYAMDDHYHAQEYLMDAIDDLESILDDIESHGRTGRDFERFAGIMADYLEEDTERTARQAAKIEDLADRLEDAYTGGRGRRGRGRGYTWQPSGTFSWGGPWMGQQQQQWATPGWNWGFNTGYSTDRESMEDDTVDEWVDDEWSAGWNDTGWNSAGWTWNGGMFQSQSMGMGGMNQVQYVGVWY